jgi:hypothetical protein
MLFVEGGVIAVLIVVAGFLIYHFTVHSIRNRRPLGGLNVNVTHGVNATENEASFAIDRARPQLLFGATNQLLTYTTGNGGRTWRSGASPAVREPACARGEPHTAITGSREVLAFLVSPTCSDQLRSYLAVTSRTVGTDRWGPAVRVAQATWKFGFDDAAALAFDARSGRLYLSWTRGLSAKLEATVVASSTDGGQSWSSPLVVAKPADEPHLSTIAVAPSGDVYVGGIDAQHGIWIARSTDAGRSFTTPRTAAPLRANPSDTCAGQSSFAPLPNEETSCLGPSPTIVATKNRVEIVYGTVGANGTSDINVAAFDATLRPLFRKQVNPPDDGKTQQLFPAATADSSTGTLWACWYDTTYDPRARRAWFTCSASHDGRSWTPPERAAAVPTQVADLFTDIRSATGFWPSVVAAGGVAHAFWIEIDPIDFAQRISTAALPERAAFVTRTR